MQNILIKMQLTGGIYMINCNIEEPIAKFQYKKNQYVICPIYGRESLLAYWYCVLSKETYNALQCCESWEEYEKFEQKLLNEAIDIRKLQNYKDLSIPQTEFNRKGLFIPFGRKDREEFVVPLIKDAVKAGFIMPR